MCPLGLFLETWTHLPLQHRGPHFHPTAAPAPAGAFFPPPFSSRPQEPRHRLDTSLSWGLIKSSLAGSGWLGVLGLEWRSISNCFPVGKKKKFSINFLRCCQTSFLFRNSAALSEVALGRRTDLWRGGRPSMPRLQNTHRRKNILEHSLAGCGHSVGFCWKRRFLSTLSMDQT